MSVVDDYSFHNDALPGIRHLPTPNRPTKKERGPRAVDEGDLPRDGVSARGQLRPQAPLYPPRWLHATSPSLPSVQSFPGS